MDHHEYVIDPETEQALLAKKRQEDIARQKLGATGRYPDGKLSQNDEGELVFDVTTFKGNVVLDFGKSIQVAAFSPAQAWQLALALRRRANEIKRGLAKE